MVNETREAITSQTNAANKILGIGAFDTDRYKRMESDWYTFVDAKGVMDDSDYVKARRDFETAYNRGYDAHESTIRTAAEVLVEKVLATNFNLAALSFADELYNLKTALETPTVQEK